MTGWEILIIACIVAPFLIFAVALAYVEQSTAEVRRKNSVPLPGDLNRDVSAPEMKKAA